MEVDACPGRNIRERNGNLTKQLHVSGQEGACGVMGNMGLKKTIHIQKRLYQIFGLKRSEVPRPMTQVLPGEERVVPRQQPTR